MNPLPRSPEQIAHDNAKSKAGFEKGQREYAAKRAEMAKLKEAGYEIVEEACHGPYAVSTVRKELARVGFLGRCKASDYLLDREIRVYHYDPQGAAHSDADFGIGRPSCSIGMSTPIFMWGNVGRGSAYGPYPAYTYALQGGMALVLSKERNEHGGYDTIFEVAAYG